MKLDILTKTGESTGRSFEFSAELLGEAPSEHAVYLAVKAYLANQRQGTHSAKERSELSGSTRKLHKQKGTGGARKGSIKSGVLHGGARIHDSPT
jgi:large subunit ribosomal protein L4